MSPGDGSLREPSPRALAPIHRPLPGFLDEQENFQFHVEKLLQKRRRQGQRQYRVKWMGIPSLITRGSVRYSFIRTARTP